MLKLDSPLVLDAEAIASPNLCGRFTKTDLDNIGSECLAGMKADEYSRQTWMKRNEAGMDLALQIVKDKTFPWPGASNVAFPLVTIAAMQFHARAYPAIISGTDVVKCEVIGLDPSGEKFKRASAISTDMSWQVLKQDRNWETEEDKMLFNVSIVGTAFKKSYFGSRAHNVSELVLAKDLVLNYYSKSVETSPRKTQLIPFFRNEIYERVLRGTFRDCLEEAWYNTSPAPQSNTKQTYQDNRQGVTPPPPTDNQASILFGEQHVNLDLDADGYAEPYIITFDAVGGNVVRIVTRFVSESDIERVPSGPRVGQIIRIKALEYYTARIFIPSPDGGVYGIGFGVFLGPLNESVNTLVNQLIDAGTMQTTSGGFLARGAKIRGGVYTIAPFEWKRVDSTGDDLRKSIYPLPVNAPSDVLFQLLSLLINYTNRIAGTTDTMVGESPGQNTPAETTRTMVEMGQKIYNALFKRMWHSLGEEFKKLYVLNGYYLPDEWTGPGGSTREDYLLDPEGICPAADPNITSDAQQLQQAQALVAAASSVPGYNMDEVQRRYLKALKISAPDQVFPGTEGQPPAKDPKLAIAELKVQGDLQGLQLELQARQQEFMTELLEERRLNNAKILELMAKAEEASANAQSEQAYAQVALINAQLSEVKSRNEGIARRVDHLLEAAKLISSHKLGMKTVTKITEDAV